jgi:hypothetical protein
MWVNFKGRFAINGANVHLDRVELKRTARTRSPSVTSTSITGRNRRIKCAHVSVFAHARNLLAKENWKLGGDGDFTGVFHLFKGGHDCPGTSPARSPQWTTIAFRRCLDRSIGRAVSLK